MFVGSMKIFFGIAFLVSAFKTGVSLASIAFGLIGLYLMAEGLIRLMGSLMNFMEFLESLLCPDST